MATTIHPFLSTNDDRTTHWRLVKNALSIAAGHTMGVEPPSHRLSAADSKNYLLRPKSVVIKLGQHLYGSCLFFSCILVFYMFAFDRYHYWNILYALDVVMLLHIFAKFSMLYIDGNGQAVTDRKSIALRYLMTTLVVDILAILPLEPLCSATYNGDSSICSFSYLRFLRMVALLNHFSK